MQNNDMPKVSVIIPVYGVEKYIERCARSLFEQTLDCIEYIFVDDCSPDKSIEILERIIEEYRPRFAGERKVVQIERMLTNSGLAAVRKHGIQFSTGDYVIHCDSDDWVDTDMYRLMYEEAKHNDADIVMCGYKVTDGMRIFNECYHQQTNKTKILSSILTMHESWSVWNKMCKRSLYDNDIVYPTLAMGEDMVLTTQLVLSAQRIAVVNKALYNYFYNPNSITNVQSESSRYKHWKDSAENAKIVFSIFKKKGLEHEYANELGYLKFLQKELAGDLARKKKYSKEWLEMFQEINWKTFSNPFIPNSIKLKYFVKLLLAQLL
mgnify:FL=1